MYYIAVCACVAAMLFAAVGWQRLVVILVPGGIVLMLAARTDLRDVRHGDRGSADRTMEYRLLGLMLIGALWVVIGILAVI
jgi:hypothetical protein